MSDDTLAALRARAADEQPILWNFLGDSITHGALHTWGRRDYVELFDERVRWQCRRILDVTVNTGFSGYTVPRVAAELEHRCLRFNPDVVSIMLGMNDAAAGPEGVAAFEAGYLELIANIRRETHALVFLHTPNRIDLANAQARLALPDYAEAIRHVAATADVPVCDHDCIWGEYERRFGSCLYLLNDPIHPNADGHMLFADTLLAWLGYGSLERKTPLEAFAPEIPV